MAIDTPTYAVAVVTFSRIGPGGDGMIVYKVTPVHRLFDRCAALMALDAEKRFVALLARLCIRIRIGLMFDVPVRTVIIRLAILHPRIFLPGRRN